MNPEEDKLNNSESREKKDQTPAHQNPDDNFTNPEDQDNENIPVTEPDAHPNKEEESSPKSHKNISRSKKNRIFLGVCGGLADYFDSDPLFFRLAFIISVIFGFWGILFYLILGIIIPEEPKVDMEETEPSDFDKENHKILIGSSLILLGIFLIVKNTRLFHFFQVWSAMAKYLVPTLLIIAGVFLLIRKGSDYLIQNKKLHRSVENKKIAGVCAGLGEYLNVDPTIIRILWLIFILSSFGIGVLIYLIFVIMVPEKQEAINENQSEYH